VNAGYSFNESEILSELVQVEKRIPGAKFSITSEFAQGVARRPGPFRAVHRSSGSQPFLACLRRLAKNKWRATPFAFIIQGVAGEA
jgi:hypothetical protein